jgi:hypothetical protein
VLSKSRIFKFLKRDCGTIPVAEIISGKIEIFSKHQRFLIATESSKYLLIFVLYVCVILCEFGTAISKRYACFCCLFKIIMSGLLLLMLIIINQLKYITFLVYNTIIMRNLEKCPECL